MSSSSSKNISPSSSASSSITLEQIEKRLADTNRRQDELKLITDPLENRYEMLEIWRERASIIASIKKHHIVLTQPITWKNPGYFGNDLEIHCLRYVISSISVIKLHLQKHPPENGSRQEEILKIVNQYENSFDHLYYTLNIQDNLKNKNHPLLTETFLRKSSADILQLILTLTEKSWSSLMKKNRFKKFITYLNKYQNEDDRKIIFEVISKLIQHIDKLNPNFQPYVNLNRPKEVLEKEMQTFEKFLADFDKLLDSPESFFEICKEIVETWEAKSKSNNFKTEPYNLTIDYDQLKDLLANFATHQIPIKSEINDHLFIEGVNNVVLNYLGYDKSINPMTFFNNPPFENEAETKATSVADKKPELERKCS